MSLTEKIDELVAQIKALCEEEGYTFTGPYTRPSGDRPAGTEITLDFSIWEPSRDWQDSSC